MADMSLDELLSSSIKSAAEPAASAGVADLIRSRVAAGDPGVGVAGTVAPGWAPARPRWFWPLTGAVVGLAAILTVLVLILLQPTAHEPSAATTAPTTSVTPTPSPTATSTPTPTPTPSVTEQAPPPPPPPPRDTTAPTISAGQWSNAEVYPTGYNCMPTTSDIVVTARDETRLRGVSASTSTATTSAVFVGRSGSAYTFRFSGTPGGSGDQQVIVTFTAVDESGNMASTSRPILYHTECIIIG